MTENKRPYPEAMVFLSLFVLNSAVAFIYNIALKDVHTGLLKRLIPCIISSGSVSLLLTVTAYYIHKYLRINLYGAIIGLTLLIVCVESFLLRNFHTLLMPSCFMAYLESTPNETAEFLSAYTTPTTLLLPILLFSAGMILFFFRRRIASIPFPAWCRSQKFTYLSGSILLVAYAGLNYYAHAIHHWISLPSLSATERAIRSYAKGRESSEQCRLFTQMLQETPPQITANRSSIPYVVIVMGESASRRHLHAYGYPLPTSPHADRRLDAGEMLRFDRVQTPSAITTVALRLNMSFFNRQPGKEWHQYHTLPSIMAAAGYETWWLSNQEGFNDQNDNPIVSIARTSSSVTFTHKMLNTEHQGYYDSELLPLLDAHLAGGGQQKRFIVLHQIGSHTKYAFRYPPSFQKFGSEDITGHGNDPRIRQTIAEYDNSILYNDFVNDSILHRFEDKEAIVFILSDHGEEVYDTRDMHGHALDNPSLPMLEIPFFVWSSASFKERHPQLWQRISASVHKEFNTSQLIHTIMDVCGIETKDYQAEESLFHQPS